MKPTTDTDRLIQAALEYAGYGWRVLPIKPASKLPLIKAWQKAASSNPAQIEAWWQQFPAANVGVCLGEGSGILDLECDSPKAEQDYLSLFDGDPPVTTTYQGVRGKHRLFRWRNDLPGGAVIKLGEIEVRTGGGGKGAQSVFPPSIHPSGVAYQWLVPPAECRPIALPDAILARLWNLAGDDLTPPEEWRVGTKSPAERAALYVDRIPPAAEGGRNAQCYRVACVLLRDFALPELDAAPLLAAYNARCTPPLGERELVHTIQSAQKYGLGVRGSKLDGNAPKRAKVWEPTTPKQIPEEALEFDGAADMTDIAQRIVAGARDVVKQDQLNFHFRSFERFNATRDAPLAPNELKAIFTFALKQERSKRLDVDAAAVLTNPPEAATTSAASALAGQKAAGVFRLVIVESDPPRYELHAPQFTKAPGSCVVLTAEQMNSATAIRVQALKQAEYPLPKIFDREWGKAGGIYEAVVHMAEHRAAPADDKRNVVIAEMLLEAITRPHGTGKPVTVEEGGEPDPRGRPCLMPDGSIVCKFTPIWEPMRRSEDRVERRELSTILAAAGAEYKNVRIAGSQHKVLRLSQDCIRKLRQICSVE